MNGYKLIVITVLLLVGTISALSVGGTVCRYADGDAVSNARVLIRKGIRVQRGGGMNIQWEQVGRILITGG